MVNTQRLKQPTDTQGRLNSDVIKSKITQYHLPEPMPKKRLLEMITRNLAVIAMVTISPELAEALLTLNTGNRPEKAYLKLKYTDDMVNGKWIFIGGMVKFDWDGVMRDGQHTLYSIIASGTSQMLNIQTGLDPAGFPLMDTGRTRSGGDVLAIKGFKSGYNQLSSAIKSIVFYERHDRIKNNLRITSISNKDVERFSDKKSEMKALVSYLETINGLKKNGKTSFMAPSTWLFVYYILSKRDKDEAADFLSKLAGGENISQGGKHAAIYLLREKLINFGEGHTAVLKMGGSFVPELKVRYIFRAWNAWRSGEKITRLVVKPKDEKMEKPL